MHFGNSAIAEPSDDATSVSEPSTPLATTEDAWKSEYGKVLRELQRSYLAIELLATDLSARIVPGPIDLSPKHIEKPDEKEKGKRYVYPFKLMECGMVSEENLLPSKTSIEFSVSNVSEKQRIKLSGAYLGNNGIHIARIDVKVLARHVHQTEMEYQAIKCEIVKWNEVEPIDICFTDDIPLENNHTYKIVVSLLDYTDIATKHYLYNYQLGINQIEGIKMSGSHKKSLISHLFFRVRTE